VQVDFKSLTSARKEVTLTIEAERMQKAYRSYLNKSAGEVQIPGFRKGKAPLHMVERNYGEKIREYFYKDFIDEAFDEATREHNIQYLLHPEIKDVLWESGQEMVIKVEIETEPEVTLKQIEGLSVPYRNLELNDEVAKYIEELRKENSTVIDVEDAIIEGDEVEFEVTCTLDEKPVTTNYITIVSVKQEPQVADAALGKKIGDSFKIMAPHAYIHHIFKDIEHTHHEGDAEASFMVNTIRRTQLPVIDDDFAKDLEFDNLADMNEKITAELAEKNELKNQNIKINALITKLYIDNRFDLPEKTIQYLAEKELDQYNINDAQWRKYYEFQIRYQITQDFINMYLMKALRKDYEMEATDADYNNYMEHEAKLNDQSVEEWKAKHKENIEDENFKETVTNFAILNKIAATCDFVITEEEPINTGEAEATDYIEDDTLTETTEKSE
jgi:trigger factor